MPRNLVAQEPLDRDAVEQLVEPRFGFIVSKKVGTAVQRNLVRRRLKAICLEAIVDGGVRGVDVVVRPGRVTAIVPSFATHGTKQ